MTNTYDVGSAVIVSSAFTANNVATDPTAVLLRVIDPNNVETDYATGALTHPSPGVYNFQIAANIVGTWRYRFEGSGAVVAVQDGDFFVTSGIPTWSYAADKLATVPLYQVRLLIGDVVDSDQQMQDQEINFFLSLRSSIYGAAAECCRALASKYSRSVDQAAGAVKVAYSQLAKAYTLKSADFDNKAALTGAAVPFLGGTSAAMAAQLNLDRFQPVFVIGMQDSQLPVPAMQEQSQISVDLRG